jgi:hypothetical protein
MQLMTTRRQLTCGSAANQKSGDGLDLDVTDEADGLRATATVDGETVLIETSTVTLPDEATDDEPAYRDFLIATVTGDDQPAYADWKLGVVSDVLSGSFAGVPFGDQAATTSAAFAELAASQVGTVLTEVSRRAAVELEADTLSDDLRLHLVTVADMGPYLQALPTILGGVDAVCGDGACTVDETDENCPEDCGCAAEEDTCGGVAPFGCYCDADCAATGDCCIDACQTCGAGCPPCGEAVPCSGSCTDITNACNGTVECPSGEDEAQCNSGTCRAGQLACDDGTCIEFYQFCDETSDCAGGEDEVCECAFCDPAG